MKQLDDSQLETFDQEYMYEKRWQLVKRAIESDFPSGDFSFLDVGGGNGMFVDRLLEAYPLARGAVLDNSELLLGKNKPHPRKQLVCDSAENLEKLGTKYDLVFFNWVLHHLVGSGYRESRENIDHALVMARRALTGAGRVSIFDNMYDGQLFDWIPSRLIYELTAAPQLKSFTRRMGANTAGIGVCFQSRRQWVDTVARAGFKTLSYHDDDSFGYSFLLRVCLHMGNVRAGHFWLAPATAA